MSSQERVKAYFGGIEGGGTGSKFIILDDSGAVVARTEGSSTNQWLIGMLDMHWHNLGNYDREFRNAFLNIFPASKAIYPSIYRISCVNSQRKFLGTVLSVVDW